MFFPITPPKSNNFLNFGFKTSSLLYFIYDITRNTYYFAAAVGYIIPTLMMYTHFTGFAPNTLPS